MLSFQSLVARSSSPRFGRAAVQPFASPFLHSSQARHLFAASTKIRGQAEDDSEEPMKALKLEIGRIFSNSDEYIFRVTKNMRNYSWERKEVETLFTDLTDSMNHGIEGLKYELNQVILLKEKETIKETKQTVWEVQDGQQRLVTLCLLYCALRDLPNVDPDLRTEIQSVLVVKTFVCDKPRPRVTLRERNNGALLQLLEGQSVPPVPSAKQKNLDLVQKQIINNYYTLLELVKGMHAENPTFGSDLYKFMHKSVYFIFIIAENGSVARKMVANARRGKNAEAIDEFKGMCILSGIEGESKQDAYLDRWVKLEDEMSRSCMEDAVMHIAQGHLGRRCKTDGEVDFLEEYWKKYEFDGAHLFDHVVCDGVRKLHGFRNDSLSYTGPAVSVRQQLVFLRDMTRLVKVASVEIAVLALLQSSDEDYIAKSVSILERVALLFASVDVTLKARFDLVFAMVHAIQNKKPLNKFDVTEEQKHDIAKSLDNTEWGGSAPKKKTVVAILRRLEASTISVESECHLIHPTNISVEHILPENPAKNSRWLSDWSNEERGLWVHRLGNLCLLNGKKNSAASNRDFAEKCKKYEEVIFPQTKEIAKKANWTPKDIKANHDHVLSMCVEVFKLH